MARAYTVRKVCNEYGLPLINIKCEGINGTSGTVVETQWTDTNGECTFTALPDAGTVVHIKIYRAPFIIEWRYDIFFDAVPISPDITESVQDIVGGMVTGNTETFITVTYEDSDGTLDFVVPVLDEDNMASNSAVHVPTQQSSKAYADTKEDETHAADHAVNAADTVFPADPNADKYLMWDDDPGALVWGTPAGTYTHPNHSGDVTSVGDGAQAIVNKQTVTFTAPLATTQAISVVAAAAPTISIPAATAAQNGYATSTQITKLDGIEAGADVTDATNVAAAGALMAVPKLDDCAAPDINTDLDASSTKHGLCPKGSGVATEFLNGNLGFSTPAGGGGVGGVLAWLGL